MKLNEINGSDVTSYKLSTIPDDEVTGNFSKDYKQLNNDYLKFTTRYPNLMPTRSSRERVLIDSEIRNLMNRTIHIDNVCVDAINTDGDHDAKQTKSNLDNIFYLIEYVI